MGVDIFKSKGEMFVTNINSLIRLAVPLLP